MNSQELIMFGGFIAILTIATATMAVADETTLIQSGLNSEIENRITVTVPHGHVEDISWVERVSNEGTIEISGIVFAIANNDDAPHSFEVCLGIDSTIKDKVSETNDSIACTNSTIIEGKSKLTGQNIELTEGVKVSNLKNVSISIKEF